MEMKHSASCASLRH